MRDINLAVTPYEVAQGFQVKQVVNIEQLTSFLLCPSIDQNPNEVYSVNDSSYVGAEVKIRKN